MKESQLHILRHSLGLTRSETAYRNHFCTGPGSDDFPDCEELVTAGLMVRRDPSPLSGGDYTYFVTDEGKQRAAEPQSPVQVAGEKP